MINPYQSPSAPSQVGSKHARICTTVLTIVMVNVVLTALNVARYWREFTLIHELVPRTALVGPAGSGGFPFAAASSGGTLDTRWLVWSTGAGASDSSCRESPSGDNP